MQNNLYNFLWLQCEYKKVLSIKTTKTLKHCFQVSNMDNTDIHTYVSRLQYFLTCLVVQYNFIDLNLKFCCFCQYSVASFDTQTRFYRLNLVPKFHQNGQSYFTTETVLVGVWNIQIFIKLFLFLNTQSMMGTSGRNVTYLYNRVSTLFAGHGVVTQSIVFFRQGVPSKKKTMAVISVGVCV